MRGKVFWRKCQCARNHFSYSATSLFGTYDHGQGPPPLGINKEESRNGGHDLDSSVSERRVQRLGGRVADALKDG